MIPVALQAEPDDFDAKVRQPGLGWLAKRGWPADAAPPVATELPPHWREVQHDLWRGYSGVCAYLSIYFEWALGAHSTDHFVAKSRHAGQAYEWRNYRLSCLGANRNKNRFDDVLDPFEITDHTFVLNLASGAISPSSALDASIKEKASKTIERLRLDDPNNRRMRTEQIDELQRGGVSPDYLRRKSPFVWIELHRQGQLE